MELGTGYDRVEGAQHGARIFVAVVCGTGTGTVRPRLDPSIVLPCSSGPAIYLGRFPRCVVAVGVCFICVLLDSFVLTSKDSAS